MPRGPAHAWASIGDLPIDVGQRDAMLGAQVRSGAGRGRWRIPEDWPGAWITPQPDDVRPDAPDGPGGSAMVVWLDGIGRWLAGSGGWARPADSRRPAGGTGVTLGLGVASQVSLWRHRRPLAHGDADEDADALARRHGPELAEVEGVPSAVADLGWSTAGLPGWVAGGPLHLPCPHHGAPLTHWRCDHAGAVGRKRRFLVGCAECDAEQISGLGKRLAGLLRARAALDAEHQDEPGSPATHHVYVVDVIAEDGGQGRYAGQTSGAIEARIEAHRRGGSESAKVFRSGASMGDLRPDLLPEAWTLTSRASALAAEAFVHRWLEAREPDVPVWGDVQLLG